MREKKIKVEGTERRKKKGYKLLREVNLDKHKTKYKN